MRCINLLNVVGAIVLLTVMAMPVWAQEVPVIATEEARFDFGVADPNVTIEHDFVIVNRGTADLKIDQIKPACGCTVAELDRQVIPPGERVTLHTRLSLKGRSGPQQKPIVIHSNDPENPEFELMLAGTARSPLRLEPQAVFFGSLPIAVPGAESPTHFVDIDVDDAHAFTIRSARVDAEGVSVDPETVIDGTAYRLRVSIDATEAGPIDGQITLQTTSQRFPRIVIPVSGVVAPIVAHTPADLLLPTQVDKPMVRYVLLNAPAGQNFEVTKVTTPHDEIQSEVSKLGKRGYRVKISGLRAEAALEGTSVVIHTDLPQQSVIQIPIRLLEPPNAVHASDPEESP